MGKIYLKGVDYSASNAKANVQSDWNVTDTTSEAYIANKPVSLPANGGNAATVNNHTVNADVPSDAKFTDTTYSAATASKAGLMSSADKTKLDGIEETLGTLANQIDELNTGLNHISNDGTTFLNYYSFAIGDTTDQTFSVPTNGKYFTLITCQVGANIIPNSVITNISWNQAGQIAITKSNADAYTGWTFGVYYFISDSVD